MLFVFFFFRAKKPESSIHKEFLLPSTRTRSRDSIKTLEKNRGNKKEEDIFYWILCEFSQVPWKARKIRKRRKFVCLWKIKIARENIYFFCWCKQKKSEQQYGNSKTQQQDSIGKSNSANVAARTKRRFDDNVPLMICYRESRIALNFTFVPLSECNAWRSVRDIRNWRLDVPSTEPTAGLTITTHH